MAKLSDKVLEEVAEAEGVDASELEIPLFEAVDPDALDRIFEPTKTNSQGNQGQVALLKPSVADSLLGPC